jgi:hypothetical protein
LGNAGQIGSWYQRWAEMSQWHLRSALTSRRGSCPAPPRSLKQFRTLDSSQRSPAYFARPERPGCPSP